MKQLSIVGKDLHTEEHALGFYTSGDRMKFWAGRGALWGSLGGMLLGSALFLLPAIGPVIVMGPLVAWIASALEGAAVGGAAGVLAAALASIGLPKESVVKYELEVKAGRFLVLVHGSSGLIEQARHLLGTTDATQVRAHVNRSGARDRAQMLLPARSGSTREGERAGHESGLAKLPDDEIALVDAEARRAHLSDG
jgi:hypothetical protein